MQEMMKKRALELLSDGTVDRVLGWKKGDFTYDITPADEDYETGLRKIGGILADDADVGCGCVLNPGTVIGKATSVYPLNSLRGVFPAGCIVKSISNVVVRRKDD